VDLEKVPVYEGELMMAETQASQTYMLKGLDEDGAGAVQERRRTWMKAGLRMAERQAGLSR